MILSATYNFFNGEEHLIASLKSIRSQVDYINIVYQTISNHGNKCTEYAKDVIFEISAIFRKPNNCKRHGLRTRVICEN